MGTKREQEYKLKDGRTIFKTHNGFKYWITDTKGKTTEVTEGYWKKVFRNKT